MRKYILLISLILMLIPLISAAQNITVEGKIFDKYTGEVLPDAHIWLPKQKRGFRSDDHGKFKMHLSGKGEYELVVSYVGYTAKRVRIALQSDTLLNVLLEQDNPLDNITVYGTRNDFGVKHTQMSAIEMPISKIEYVPAVFGEVDVMKALQTLPGVQSSSEGHAGIFVRGGGYDQNQITLDGVTMYNAEHLKGLMSAINSDMVENLVFYKGAFPARYGGQLSSIVDIVMKDGDMEDYHGEATVGVLSSKIRFEGPLSRGRTSFNMAARGSYLNLLVQPALEKIADNENSMIPYANLNFYDVNAKITHLISDKHKLSGYFYIGRDNSEESPSDGHVDMSNYYPEKRIMESTEKNSSSYSRNDWGNVLSSLLWIYTPDDSFSLKSTASYSIYDYYMRHHDYKEERYCQVNVANNDTLSKKIAENTSVSEHDSYIKDISLSVQADYKQSARHRIRFGCKASVQTMSPTIHLYKNKYLYSRYRDNGKMQEITNVTTKDSIIGNNNERLVTGAIYAEDEISIAETIKANLGLRYVLFGVDDKIYHSLEPRASVRWLLRDEMSLKVSYARMAQGIHMLGSSDLVSPSDIWVPITENISPMKSDQFAAGYNYEPAEGISLSIEGYYKKMKNLLEYKEGASYMTSGKEWNNIVSVGDGKSYGVELYAQKDVGKTTGWLSYTWSRSLRTFDRPGEELNGGRSFYSGTDRRHNFNIVVMHKINDRFDVSLSWTFQSGRRGNIPTDSFIAGIEGEKTTYHIPQFSGASEIINYGSGVLDGVIGGFAPLESYKGRNCSKLPSSHRLDLSANYRIPHIIMGGEVESIINLSVYNVYNRFNVNNVYWGYSSYENSPEKDAVLKGVCLLPIMPSVSYTLKF